MPHEFSESERLTELDRRADTQDKALEKMDHFLFGNAREGFVQQVGLRLKRIEIIGALILGMIVARTGIDVVEVLAKVMR